jgi:diguanylate cyclase (GGDEF)-like protein
MKEAIQELFQTAANDDRALIDGLEVLANEHGDIVYQEVLRHLVDKCFSIDLAGRYWRGAIAHREHVLVRERIENGLRPALLDYLHQMVHEISDPRIVEAQDLETIRKASMSDGLTGLFNQTYFKSYLEKLVGQRPQPGETTTAVVLLDLDHFKQYNDRCGHLAGDEALKKVAELILAGIRQGDVAARYGGEEFGVVLHHITPEQTFTVTNRIRAAIEGEVFAGQENLDRNNLTISAGFALRSDPSESAVSLIRRADDELYRAKLFRNAISPHKEITRVEPRMQRRSLVEYALIGSCDFLPALSRNISPYGIAIECEYTFPVGTPLQLRFREPFWPGGRLVVASVCHVSKEELSPARIGLKFNPEHALSQESNIIDFVRDVVGR